MSLQEEILKELYSNQQEKYTVYTKKVVTTTSLEIIGVRMAVLHDMAERYKDRFLEIAQLPYTTYEELMFKGLVIAKADAPISQKKKVIRRFLELVDNWAIVDSFAAAFLYKESERSYFIAFAKDLAFSDQQYVSRAGIVLLSANLHDSVAIDRAYRLFDRLVYGQPAKDTAVAWAIATYSHYDESRSLEFFINSDIPISIKLKAAQKIRESRRLSDDYKDKITYLANYEKVWRKKQLIEERKQKAKEERLKKKGKGKKKK